MAGDNSTKVRAEEIQHKARARAGSGLHDKVNVIHNRYLTENPRLAWQRPHGLSSSSPLLDNFLDFTRYGRACFGALEPFSEKPIVVGVSMADVGPDRQFDGFRLKCLCCSGTAHAAAMFLARMPGNRQGFDFRTPGVTGSNG